MGASYTSLIEHTAISTGKASASFRYCSKRKNRLLIVSGANAGGKSLCLKTVALLQYMLQCGLLIPVHENSRTGIFDHIFVDIGDGQSIENSLSTYTSHLTNMKYLWSNVIIRR